ncbi:MAG TPA: dynamin family protein [Micromonosporaceae bacterium]|nr:dynamin family protein [Micromonosporaceae bacterium]
MTEAPQSQAPGVLSKAIGAVDLGLKACAAYGRPDLASRLTAMRRRLADPAMYIVVVGEFKKGKSSLVNALIGASACPVDDDVATAVPTYVRHGATPQAELFYEGDPPRREPVAVDQVRTHILERAELPSAAQRLIGVEVRLPRKLLGGGLVLVDTPGVGGLRSAHAAASLAATALADAVLFVTDAGQELTHSELEFLRRTREMCDTVACVITKTDFYPSWRKIQNLNERHLAREFDLPLIAVSSALRSRAVATSDKALNVESGFPELVRFVTARVAGSAASGLAIEAAGEVAAVCDQIEGQFTAERAALADPAAAKQVLEELAATKERVAAMKSSAAKWNQTLNDGIADLTSDIDHDLRRRIRAVVEESDTAIDDIDPADSWSEMESWLEARLSHELLANYALLRDRAAKLSAEVGEHFREASGQVLNRLAVHNPTPLVSGARVEHRIELEKMRVRKQAMVALKSAYGGTLMFTMLGTLAGIMLGPLSLGIGLVMGHKGLREEKKRQRQQRQSQAKNAVRRYCDEVSFVAGKDSRDTLRRVQRQLRDHYSTLAEELNRSNAEALTAAAEAAKRTQAEREKRLKDIDAELARLRQLRQRATAVTG